VTACHDVALAQPEVDDGDGSRGTIMALRLWKDVVDPDRPSIRGLRRVPRSCAARPCRGRPHAPPAPAWWWGGGATQGVCELWTIWRWLGLPARGPGRRSIARQFIAGNRENPVFPPEPPQGAAGPPSPVACLPRLSILSPDPRALPQRPPARRAAHATDVHLTFDQARIAIDNWGC
jgi:hypothetical protein